jgi:clan AA aspartic protease (TIGR02281 family)
MILLTAGLLLASGSSAEIYRWVDEAGNLHFAQSLQQVPARYRAQAQQPSSPAKNSGHFQAYSNLPTASDQVDRPETSRTRVYKIPFRHDGGLMRVDAVVNDHVTVPFLIDTGASGVALPEIVAKDLGIVVGPDTPRITSHTANGTIEVPLVEIQSVTLGGARVENLTATLNPTLEYGLLGGAFFNNFDYQIAPNESVMTLTPNFSNLPTHGEDSWRARFAQLRDSLTELDAYLEEFEDELKEKRREELYEKREEILAKLEVLDVEANDGNVPHAWRQ